MVRKHLIKLLKVAIKEPKQSLEVQNTGPMNSQLILFKGTYRQIPKLVLLQAGQNLFLDTVMVLFTKV